MNVIEVDHISKKFKLGVYGGKSLRDDLSAWIAKMRGKENPLITIGDEARLDAKGEFWALKDINFSVAEGEVLGIIGKNGAGKSTLLKLLSRISYPTQGEIRIKGRMASLLEVGTGFHPELTGRENVFLNGAILGMTRNDVQLKFDEIVAFSGIEHHIDTPVKRYSSGMKVRLGFAVAAHLEPEILVVDEVLAVGDAEFQRKCIGKMQDVAGNGRTVLFVSHNLMSVKSLCSRAILLEQGKLIDEGDVEKVISKYILDDMNKQSTGLVFPLTNNNETDVVIVNKFEVVLERGKIYPSMDDDLTLLFNYQIKSNIDHLNLVFHLINSEGIVVFGSSLVEGGIPLNHDIGNYQTEVVIPANLLNADHYRIKLMIVDNGKVKLKMDNFCLFEIQEGELMGRQRFGNRAGVVRPKLKWKKTKT